jgi:hypothetical protein
VQEANREDEGSPFVIWFNLLKEVLVDHSVKGSGKTGLKTLWWLSCDLDSHLKKTKWERVFWQACDPKSEIFMDLFVLRIKDVFHLCHELNTQMAVVENNPFSRDESLLD